MAASASGRSRTVGAIRISCVAIRWLSALHVTHCTPGTALTRSPVLRLDAAVAHSGSHGCRVTLLSGAASAGNRQPVVSAQRIGRLTKIRLAVAGAGGSRRSGGIVGNFREDGRPCGGFAVNHARESPTPTGGPSANIDVRRDRCIIRAIAHQHFGQGGPRFSTSWEADLTSSFDPPLDDAFQPASSLSPMQMRRPAENTAAFERCPKTPPCYRCPGLATEDATPPQRHPGRLVSQRPICCANLSAESGSTTKRHAESPFSTLRFGEKVLRSPERRD